MTDIYEDEHTDTRAAIEADELRAAAQAAVHRARCPKPGTQDTAVSAPDALRRHLEGLAF